MVNVSTSKTCAYETIQCYITNGCSITQKDIMDLEQLAPLSEETGMSVDQTVVTWIYQVFQ